MTERGQVRPLRARLHRDERGFTMIEVAVAMLVFGVLILGVATTQSASTNLIRTNRHRSVAANLAADEMDGIRTLKFATLKDDVGVPIESVRDVGGVDYTITRYATWGSADATAGPCDAPDDDPNRPDYLQVDVSVSWPVMSGVKPVTSHTVITPPVGAYDVNAGHIRVKVKDRDGLPQSNVQVVIAGPQNDSQVTTSDGCAFFAFLPPGSYAASVSAVGYVNYGDNSPAPTQAASVTVGSTQSLEFVYDAAATLEVTFVGKDVGAPAPADIPLALSNSHAEPPILISAVTGNPRQVPGLFPYADGYQARAGACADATSADSPIAVQPGAITSAVVLLPEVRVTVEFDDGLGTMTPVSGAVVQAAHGPDSGCPTGETFSPGVTDGLGQLVFALPFGAWDITVDGLPAGTVTLSPTDPPGPLELLVTQS